MRDHGASHEPLYLSLSSRHFKSVCLIGYYSLSLSLSLSLPLPWIWEEVSRCTSNTSTFYTFCSWIRELFLSSHALELSRPGSCIKFSSFFLSSNCRVELILLSGGFCSNLACTNYDGFVSYEKFKHLALLMMVHRYAPLSSGASATLLLLLHAVC